MEIKSFIKIIKKYIFPYEIERISPNEIYEILPAKMRRGVGLAKIERLVAVSKNSIGMKDDLSFAKLEINYLLEKYDGFLQQINEIDKYVTDICSNLDETSKIIQIKGIGIVTASSIVAERLDIRKYENSKQMIKTAGLFLTENSSDKVKGITSISRRGRKDLRRFLN